MEDILQIDAKACRKCYACVRVCPVKAIQMTGNDDVPVLHQERCIACGTCYRSCEYKAITYKDSRAEVNELLNSEHLVAAIVDPSICAEFDDITDYRKFVQMIRQLGFDFVHEVSFGVDLVAKEFARLMDDFKGKYYITANCPAITYYVEKYYPEQVNNLAPIVTPMSAMAQAVRKIHGDKIKVVYIGPCIAAKREVYRQSGQAAVDAVLTFIGLRELFDAYQIKEKIVEFSDFDTPLGYKGSIYPISEGFIEAAEIDTTLLGGTVTTAEGKKDALDAVKQFSTDIDFIKQHFNLFYCSGCQMGPGSSLGGKKYIRHTLTTNYAAKRLNNFDLKQWEDDINKYYQAINMSAVYYPDSQTENKVDENKLREVLRLLGKSQAANNDTSACEACGFTSCRDLAVSVAQGIASIDMCSGYAHRKKVQLERKLKKVQEDIAKVESDLQTAQSSFFSETEKYNDAYNTIYTLMQNIRPGMVLVDEKLKIILANKSFVSLLGEEVEEIEEIIPGLVGADLNTLLPQSVLKLFTFALSQNEPTANKDIEVGENLLNISVFPIRKDKLACAIIRDMFSPEVRNEEVINRVTDVIEENLSTVQQMGFLLGENAAKTEKMLNSIIESFKKK